MEEDKPAERIEHLEPLISTARHRRVILDADLARLYGVTTKALNQAVNEGYPEPVTNCDRFPEAP
jgi:hypothetical protein